MASASRSISGAFGGERHEVLRPLARGQSVGKAQHAGVVGGGLAMRAGRRRKAPRRAAIAHDVSGEECALGIMRQPRQIALFGEPRLDRPGKHLAIERPPPQRIDAFEHRVARQLVPERHAVAAVLQQAEREALGEARRGSGELLDQRHVEARADDGGEIERRPGLRREPRRAPQHRIAHRDRNAGFGAGDRFGNEERIAAGLAIERIDIDAMALGELQHRGRG